MPQVPASKLLTWGVKSTAGYDEVYVCPADTTTIVKSLLLMQHNAGTFVLDVIAYAVPGTGVPLYHLSLGQYATLNQSTWFVLHPGMYLMIQIAAGGLWSFWFSGTELQGVPEHPTVPGLTDGNAVLEHTHGLDDLGLPFLTD